VCQNQELSHAVSLAIEHCPLTDRIARFREQLGFLSNLKINSLRITMNDEVHNTRLRGDIAQIIVIICFGILDVLRILEICTHLIALNAMCNCKFERLALARQNAGIPTEPEIPTHYSSKISKNYGKARQVKAFTYSYLYSS
jgi:hypothetical protein